jgi:hypothetical protein
MQRLCYARTALGTYAHTVPAGATLLLEFECTSSNAVVSLDPSLTAAIWVNPSVVGPRDVLWAVGFFHSPVPIPVVEGKTLYVAIAGAAHYILAFDGPAE